MVIHTLAHHGNADPPPIGWNPQGTAHHPPDQQYRCHNGQLADFDTDIEVQQRRDTYEESVTGLGDDALWGTTTVTLLVKKNHFVLSITLDCMDKPHDNLAKAKEVAALALQKL